MTRKKQRTILILAGLALLAAAAAMVLTTLNDTIVFFYSPSEVMEKNISPGTRFRIGGLVEKGSLVRGQGKTVTFRVTDNAKSMKITYTGTLPDLFREGQGVVAEGRLEASGTFVADTVLAKHDEKYMPREVADTLKKQGYWKHAKDNN